MIDSQLLDRFIACRDASAFRDLVTRHGPVVRRTCRQFLHDPHEADDAFQATFLILVQRAPSIRDPERLDRWLVGVARRVAARSRRNGVVRSERERRWAEMHPEAGEQDWPLIEVRRVVREEIGHLPEAYFQPLALCYLEGLTHEEAARRLGWPVGTVKVRLVRARRQLRDRLDRRGIGLSVAFLLFLMRQEASSSIPVDLSEAALEAMALALSNDLVALKSRFPGAFELARFARVAGKQVRRGTTFLLVLGLLVASTGGVALAHRIKSDREKAAEASARLVKVLDVDCR